MNPDNIAVLRAGNVDCCALANNHVLDWGEEGLRETLRCLRDVSIKAAGAGGNRLEASAPAILDIPGKGRILVYAVGSETSGIPSSWAATDHQPGINLLDDLSDGDVQRLGKAVAQVKRDRDVVVASIHWGGNWGYDIPLAQRKFAHQLIDTAGVDVVHGHSAHHVKAMEIYQGRLILYGCGDFLDDYEGICGMEEYHADLGLIYLVRLEPQTGSFAGLRMAPTQVRRMRVQRAPATDAHWLSDVLNRESGALGVRVNLVGAELHASRSPEPPDPINDV
jgi:poly-gamma-glutamate synthesis protein (capsule biosynthesis protein)